MQASLAAGFAEQIAERLLGQWSRVLPSDESKVATRAGFKCSGKDRENRQRNLSAGLFRLDVGDAIADGTGN